MKLIFDSLEEVQLFSKMAFGDSRGKTDGAVKEEVSGQEDVKSMAPAISVSVPPAAPVVNIAPAGAVPISTVPTAPITPTSAQVAPQRPPAPTLVPTAAVSYTADELSRAAMTLMDAGRQPELIQLLQQFGVTSIPTLPKEQYGAFATALRGMGAAI